MWDVSRTPALLWQFTQISNSSLLQAQHFLCSNGLQTGSTRPLRYTTPTPGDTGAACKHCTGVSVVLSSLSWIPRVFLFSSIKRNPKISLNPNLSLQSEALSRKPLRSSYESVYVPPFFVSTVFFFCKLFTNGHRPNRPAAHVSDLSPMSR